MLKIYNELKIGAAGAKLPQADNFRSRRPMTKKNKI